MHRILFLLLAVLLIAPPGIHRGLTAQETPLGESGSDTLHDSPFDAANMERSLEGEFGAEDIAGTNAWVGTLGLADWLGPLAPVALSPFFGVTCLSGLAIWGPEWVTDNALLGDSGPLQNPVLFLILLLLTLLTSLPRLTKVSKPFAQAVDRIETYAVIIILLAIKISVSMEADNGAQVAMVQLGIFSFTLDTLLAIAMVINILVINSVKFFFEFLVWLTPIPLLDAVFEVGNKSVCAALMTVYALSPTLATIINLAILLVAAIMLRWVSRRTRFYRSMILDPLLSRCWPGFGRFQRNELIVFPVDDFGPYPAKSRLLLTTGDTEGCRWNFREANWWMPASKHSIESSDTPRVFLGWIMNTIEIDQVDAEPAIFRFSKRYDQATLAGILSSLHLNVYSDESAAPGSIDPSTEFA